MVRPLAIACLSVALGLANAVAKPAPNTAQWKPLLTAFQEARQAKKLVLIVQGPGEILTHPSKQPAAETYFKSAFADPLDKDFFDFRLAATYQPAGVDLDIRKQQPTHANVVTYFCVPSKNGTLQTLHFFVGYPTAKQLRAHCDWASSLYDQIAELPPTQRSAAVRNAHEDKLLLDQELPKAEQLSIASISRLLKQAATSRDNRLRDRFGKEWTEAEQAKLFESIRIHADLEDTTGHTILAVHPLVPISVLSEPVFELMTRQAWSRQPSIVGWLAQQRRRDRPLVLFGTARAKVLTPPVTRSFTERSLQLKNKKTDELLGRFDWLELKPKQLAEIAADFGLTLPARKRFNDLRMIATPAKAWKPVYVKKYSDYSTLRRKLMEILSE